MGKPVPRSSSNLDTSTISPTVGEGPGSFREADSLTRTGWRPSPHRLAPSVRFVVASAAATKLAVKAKPPPKTKPDKTRLLITKNKDVDIDVYTQVLADGVHSDPTFEGAKTSFANDITWTLPNYSIEIRHKVKTVTKLTSPFKLRGAIKIQTLYGQSAKPDQPSCYGRGTTATDKQVGNVSFGFHEHCHRQDFLNYLADNALVTFQGKAGMVLADYERAVEEFKRAWDKYFADMQAYTEASTDEVGYKKSEYKRTGKCSP